jgi:radical SAM superfamily enzyme YgiQ (UPF0313 family)
MKITLIQPPKPSYGVEAEAHWELARPLSLHFLAASIEKHTCYEVDIVDLEHRKFRGVSLDEVFQRSAAAIFGITSTTYTRFEAIKIAKYLKKAFSQSLIVAGGVHFMGCPKDTLDHVAEIDVIVRGEGERTIVDLINAVAKGADFAGIKGITYRRDGKILESPDQTYFENLDDIPHYDKFSWEEYPEYLFGSPERVPALSILSSRGCPYHCVFCSKAGMKYRLRSAKRVVDEMEYFMGKFDIHAFNFLDLTFTANPMHTRAVCEEIIGRKLGIRWWCESRANIDLGLLPLMKKAGCSALVIGVETGSPKILSQISKGITIEQVIAIVKRCSDLGINISPYFMFSHENERMKDVKMTLDLIRRLGRFIASSSFQPTMIFPGTQLEENARHAGILPPDFSWTHHYDAEVNRELGQLPNIPLYMDKLHPAELKVALREYRRIWETTHAADFAADLSMKELLCKICETLLHGNESIKYLFSMEYYRKFIEAKVKGRSRKHAA